MKLPRWRRRQDEDLEDEIQTHFEMAKSDRMERGETAEEAQHAVQREFGNVPLVKEVTRDMWGWTWLERLAQDVRFGLRMLRKRPGFTVVAVLTLALGIGANTAIFSAVNAYLFRPLPVREPGALVALGTVDQHSDEPHATSYLNYLDIRLQRDVFIDTIAYVPDIVSVNLDGQAERTMIELVSGNFFVMLGVDAALGRTFAPDEGETRGVSPVIVLSYGYWRRRFAGDPSVVGRTVRLNNQTFTVIGVTPERFTGTESILSVSAYVPLTMKAELHQNDQSTFTRRDAEALRVLGRLKPGVSVGQAAAAMEVLGRQLGQQYSETYQRLGFVVVPETRARPSISASSFVPGMAGVLMALAGLILVIACANVANLIMARAALRQREFAVRAALGASRPRLLRLLLVESLLLSALSGLAGGAIAFWGARFLSSIKMATDNPVRFDVRPDWRVFVFAVVAALVTGVIAGWAPAFRSSRVDPGSALKEGGRGNSGAHHRLRNALVVSQVAASLLLLICAGLFVRSMQRAETIDLGFRRQNVLMFSLDVELQSYGHERGQKFYADLVDRLKELPQVRSAGLGTQIPLVYVTTADVLIPGRSSARAEDAVSVIANRVSPGYFQTMGIAVPEGRAFTVRDDESAPRVAIVNEAMARRYWPGENPVGKQVRRERAGSPVEIIGVARNSKYASIGEEPRPCLYLPFAQSYQSSAVVFLQTEGDPAGVAAAATQVVRALDPGIPVYDLKTMNAHLDGIALLLVRVGAALVGLLGLLGLLLTVVGLYGVISQSVGQRTHEIGIRMALGAKTGQVLATVLKQGALLTAIGVAAGLAAAAGVTRLMRSLLYGVSATDPTVFAGVTALLAVVAILACYVPARRAATVDPTIALRHE